MRVVVMSMFSTSTEYLCRYFDQIYDLRRALSAQGHELRLILCEGDSKDDTWDQLHEYVISRGLTATLLQHHHGNLVFESVEVAARFAQLSRIWDEMLEYVSLDDDIVVIVEGDLIWETGTILRLISDAEYVGGIVGPMVFEGADRFHDVWGYRRNGERFTNEPPYHPDLEYRGRGLMLMDSIGSCLAMPARVARLCRTTREDELVGFCNTARANGYAVWVNSGLCIEHSSTR